jgi:hypothetical protein
MSPSSQLFYQNQKSLSSNYLIFSIHQSTITTFHFFLHFRRPYYHLLTVRAAYPKANWHQLHKAVVVVAFDRIGSNTFVDSTNSTDSGHSDLKLMILPT